MFEDVFEPFDDIIDGDPIESDDDWNADLWDTGEKEDMWRSDAKDVWSVNSPTAPEPSKPDPEPDANIDNFDDVEYQWPFDEKDECPDDESESKDGKDSGLFEDLF